MNEEKNQGGHAEAKITINTIKRSIHRGRRTVVEIKTVGEVPLADILNQVIGGKLIPLEDNDSVVIKGGETFISHPQDSSAS